jgi:folate-binding protein YgfZ
MPNAKLTGRAIIEIDGPEAEHFLQNVITTDLNELGDGVAMGGALLTPQGKILADFLISRKGKEAFRMETNAALCDDLARRLTMFKLRAKAEIRQLEESLVGVSWGEDSSASTNDSTVRDGRFPEEQKVFRQYGKFDATDSGEDPWKKFRVAFGIAECGTDFDPATMFPHDVLMDRNNGVSFRKGCYVGQEVVSRMQHRGTARRRIMIAEADAALPAPGTDIDAETKPVGQLISVSGSSGMAMVRIDKVGEAAGNGVDFAAGGIGVRLRFPDWSKISLPAGPQGENA